MRTLTLATGSEGRAPLRERGFTILELVLVMVVMCLVAALILPSMLRGRTAFHLRAVSRDVINAVRIARETAVTQQKVMMVRVDSQSRQVTVSDDVGDDARWFVTPADVMIEGLTAAGESVRSGPLAIRFLPNGSGEDAQILLKSDTGATLRIVVDPILGGARVVPDQGARIP